MRPLPSPPQALWTGVARRNIFSHILFLFLFLALTLSFTILLNRCFEHFQP